MMHAQLAGHGAMFLFSALVAGSFSLGATAANEIDPLALTAVRFVLAAVLLTLVARILHPFQRKWLIAPWRYAAMGAAMAIYFILMFVALKTAAPISTSAVFTLAPIFSALFGYMLLRQRTTPWIVLALSVGAIGALWVIFRGSLSAFLSLNIASGEAIFIIGTASHALYAPLVPLLNRGEPTVAFTAGMLIAGSAILLVIGAPALVQTNWAALSPLIWGIIVYLSVGTTATTFFQVQFAAQRLPASKVMAYTYIIPSWVALWEVARGNAPPDAIVLWGVGLTIIALIMLLRK